MSHKDDRATEAAVLRCERALLVNPAWRWSDEYRRYHEAVVADIGLIRYRPGFVTQLRRRMGKIKPILPPVADGATEAAEAVQS